LPADVPAQSRPGLRACADIAEHLDDRREHDFGLLCLDAMAGIDDQPVASAR
jgi:hypothetical protein